MFLTLDYKIEIYLKKALDAILSISETLSVPFSPVSSRPSIASKNAATAPKLGQTQSSTKNSSNWNL